MNQVTKHFYLLRSLFSLSLVLNILFLKIDLTYAGEGHDHNHEAAVEPAPHGGTLRDAPPYKTEIVLNGDNVKIYVYDKNLQPIATELLGKVAVGQLAFPKDETKKEVSFNYGRDSYEATVSGISKVHRYDLHVDITIEGKKIFADFGVDNIH